MMSNARVGVTITNHVRWQARDQTLHISRQSIFQNTDLL